MRLFRRLERSSQMPRTLPSAPPSPRKSRPGKLRRRAHEPSVSHLRRPPEVDAKEWQTRLRKQFGRAQPFTLINLTKEPVFSDFEVGNPTSGNSYRVAIRGMHPGDNFCACPDFATNDLGTCKHVEFTLGKLARKAAAKKALAAGHQPLYSEIYLQYGGERRVVFRAGQQCPRAVAARAARLFGPAPGSALPAERFDELPGLLNAAHKAGHELRCYEDVLNFIAQARDARERDRVLAAEYPRGAKSPALKNLVKADLYPYQAQGVLFAVRAGRCLIGDEMGLGKTLQALAAAELFARHFGVQRVLVVCPTSLKTQWQREMRRFTEREAMVISGSRAARQAQYAAQEFCKIANYDVLAKDLDAIRGWSPDLVIVDEAQRVKNWNTIAARALRRIETPYAIVLTGTPLENRLEELLSIVQYVDRHRLGATWRLRMDHQRVDEAGRVIGYRDLDKIGRTLQPILLRRRKSEVLTQLPPRIDNTVFVPMSDEQQFHHDENGEIVDRIVRRWRKTGYLSDADQRRLTCCLQNMRMSCNSTFLLDQKTVDGAKIDELMTLLEEMFERPETKAVVFSQWLGTHELIRRRLAKRDWGHVLFHGGVPSSKRAALVDKFNADPNCRLFLTTDAGGVGLNLQHAAATVINMDMPWNPAVLEQRIGRVHRLGQSRSVQVINFVAEGTIEERMLSILAFKKSLFAGVLDGGESEVFLGGTKLSRFMENVAAVTTPGETEGRAGPQPSQSPLAAPAPPEATVAPDSNSTDAAPLPQLIPGNHSGGEENPWARLLDAGLGFLQSLNAAASKKPGRSGANGHSPGAGAWVEKDATTGRAVLKLPLPDPQVLQQVATALAALLAAPRR